MSNVRPRVARPCERTPKNADLTEATKEVTTTAMRSFSTTSDLFRLSRINNPSFLLVGIVAILDLTFLVFKNL